MNKGSVAITISVISLLCSFTALAWNIYKELGLRARVTVSCMVAVFMAEAAKESKILISAVNRGPGSITLKSIVLRTSWLGRLKKQPKYFTVIPDWNHVVNTNFPAKLDVGEQATFIIPHTANSFLSSPAVARVGLVDTFNREHWAPRKHVRRARHQFQIDFPSASPRKAG